MERYEIGDDERLTAMVEAATRGEEAVFTKHGTEVGAMTPMQRSRSSEQAERSSRAALSLARLRAVHEALPPGLRGGGAALIREMRDMDEH